MGATLSWFHLGLVFVVFGAVAAVIATVSLGQFIARLEAQHGAAWRALGSPRMGTPGAGMRLFKYLGARGYEQLGDPATARLAQRAYLIGWAAFGDVAMAAIFFALFFAGVPLPDFLAGIPVPF